MSAADATEATETPVDRAVRETVAAAPPLTDDTRAELVRLLSKGAA